jgi:hypothetical protein
VTEASQIIVFSTMTVGVLAAFIGIFMAKNSVNSLTFHSASVLFFGFGIFSYLLKVRFGAIFRLKILPKILQTLL